MFNNKFTNIMYCDHCGEEIQDMDSTKNEPNYVGSLPLDINSADFGESATLCDKCFWFVQHSVIMKSD